MHKPQAIVDHANRANADAQKNIRLYQDRVKEVQTQIEAEQRETTTLRDAFSVMEKRCSQMQLEKNEIQSNLQQVSAASVL